LDRYLRIAYYTASLLRHTHWSRARLERHQNRKVREVVSYAYDHVPFYHRKFDELGLKPQDITGVKDLNRIPIVRRNELQEKSDQLVSCDFDASKLKTVSTSGSTGRPFFTHLTSDEDIFRKVKLMRANMICGQRLRDKWIVITAPQHEAHALAFQRFLGVFSPVPISVFDSPAEQVSKIERLDPDVLDGYSSSILLLARELEGRRPGTIRPRMAIGGAELIDASSRRYVEQVLGAPFYDEYACVELERLAWQCEEKTDHHIDADTVVMQFVDKNGDEVAPGETGEIVCTSLFNYAMPFIRYAVGDIGRPSRETVCRCGREFPLMSVIEGRKEEMILLPDGRVLSPLAIGDCMCAYSRFDHIVQYRFIQEKTSVFRVLVAKKKEGVAAEVMEKELLSHLRGMLRLGEEDADIYVEFVDEIPADTSGKIRKVVSNVRRSTVI